MEIEESKAIHGLKLIKPSVFHDFRGEYVCTYNADSYDFYDDDGTRLIFREDDLSIARKDVIKGIHGDSRTTKLVQCIYGAFYLVVVDNRPQSPTYLTWQSFTLSDKNRHQVLIPAGCGNAHLCLTDTCAFSYKQTHTYQGSDKQFTLRWDDPALKIYWPIDKPIVSLRDSTCPLIHPDSSSKLLEMPRLLKKLAHHKEQKHQIVFTNGCFDILHPGHIDLLKQAKAFGQILVVGLNSDRSIREIKGSGRPIRNEHDRATMLAAVESVDYIVIFDEPEPSKTIEAIVPDILVKGSDWANKTISGQDFVNAHGGRCEFIKLTEGYSTTEELKRIRE